MTTRELGTLALLVQTERKDGFFHVRLYPVRLDTCGANSVRNICSSAYDAAEDLHNGFYLPDLIIDSQGNDDTTSISGAYRARQLYGFQVSYTPYRVTAYTATRMAKSLTTLDKRLEKIALTRGCFRSFGEFVGRVAEVMGIEEIVYRPKSEAHHTMHSEGRYARRTLGDGVTYIDGTIREWIEAGEPKPAAVAS